MLIEIHDIPNNQVLKSLDVHIDFADPQNTTWKTEVSPNGTFSLPLPPTQPPQNAQNAQNLKNSGTVDGDTGAGRIAENKVIIADITSDQIEGTEIPKEMVDASF